MRHGLGVIGVGLRTLYCRMRQGKSFHYKKARPCRIAV
jgi:hypothetical protein